MIAAVCVCALPVPAHSDPTIVDGPERRSAAAVDLLPRHEVTVCSGITISASTVRDGQAADLSSSVSAAVLPNASTAQRLPTIAMEAHESGLPSENRSESRTTTSQDGVTSSTSYADAIGDVLVSMRDPSGDAVGVPFVANQSAAAFYYGNAISVTCASHGNFVATWLQSESGCAMARSFDQYGRALGEEATLHCPESLTNTIVEGARGGDRETWLVVAEGDVAGVLRFDASTSSVVANTYRSIPGTSYGWPVIGAHGDTAVIAWENRGVWASMVSPDGVTDLTRIDVYPFGQKWRIDVQPLSGSFLVSWHSDEQGGRVGREVSRVPLDVPSSTPTTTLPMDDEIEFGEPIVLDRRDDKTWIEQGGRHDLATDHRSVWLTTWRRSDIIAGHGNFPLDGVAHSSNNGRSWSEEPVRDSEDLWGWWDTLAAADGAGSWLQVWNGWASSPTGDDALWMSRSTNDARSWEAPRILDAPPATDSDYHGHVIFSVVSPSPKTWIVPLLRTTNSNGGDTTDSAFVVYRSQDDAASWQKIASIEAGPAGYAVSGSAAAAADGKSFVVWTQGGDLRLATSPDGGRTWATPHRLHSDRGVSYGAVKDVHAAMTPDGVAVVVWQATGLFGADADIAFCRSKDGGQTWSRPAPLADYAGYDEDADGEPSIAVDANGYWAAAWVTHFDRGGAWGLDADVVVSESSDGSHWSPARRMRPDSAGENILDIRPRIAVAAPGVWGVLWVRKTHPETGSYDSTGWGDYDELLFTRWNENCGNGRIDDGEDCDDGNTIDGDACDSDCRPPSCGNGIVDSDEECDDANDIDADACLGTCRRARCGDGVLWKANEGCDDGNRNTHDACTNKCNLARCGDGIVETGAEECDDDNARWTDGCLPVCLKARCGDGILETGVEDCDDGNDDDTDSCTSDCTFGHGCVNPLQRTVTQALGVLDFAMEKLPICPIDDCDANSDGNVTSTDALDVLRNAVGLAESACVPSYSWFAIRLQSPVSLGALQVRVDYDGAFDRVARNVFGAPDCSTPLENGLLAANDLAGVSVDIGLIATTPFAGPRDLVLCRIESDFGIHGDLGVTIEDASTSDGDAIDPPPVVIAVPR